MCYYFNTETVHWLIFKILYLIGRVSINRDPQYLDRLPSHCNNRARVMRRIHRRRRISCENL